MEVLYSLGDESAADDLLPPTRRNYPAASAAQLRRAQQIVKVLAKTINLPGYVKKELTRSRRLGKQRGGSYDKSIAEIVREWDQY